MFKQTCFIGMPFRNKVDPISGVRTLNDGVTPEWAGQLIVQGTATSEVFMTRGAPPED